MSCGTSPNATYRPLPPAKVQYTPCMLTIVRLGKNGEPDKCENHTKKKVADRARTTRCSPWVQTTVSAAGVSRRYGDSPAAILFLMAAVLVCSFKDN